MPFYKLCIFFILIACGSHKNPAPFENFLLKDFETEKKVFSKPSASVLLEGTLISRIKFLEHILDEEKKATTNLIVSLGSDLYLSENLGQSFKLIYEGSDENWIRCFSYKGYKLLWDNKKKDIIVFDKDWKKIYTSHPGTDAWHGSSGIDARDGVIMFAEYASDESEFNQIMQSKNYGKTWTSVFKQKGYGSKPNHEIRHFHTLQIDPFEDETWYASSGDASNEKMIESKVWKSSNNGTSWLDVSDYQITQKQYFGGIHRYTSIQFTKDYLYWVTDDPIDGTSKFVRTKRTEPFSLEILGKTGNLSRSLVKTKFGFVNISEFKDKDKDFNIHLLREDSSIEDLYTFQRLENDEERTGVTYSLASQKAKDGIFFSHFPNTINFVFRKDPGMVLWKITQN